MGSRWDIFIDFPQLRFALGVLTYSCKRIAAMSADIPRILGFPGRCPWRPCLILNEIALRSGLGFPRILGPRVPQNKAKESKAKQCKAKHCNAKRCSNVLQANAEQCKAMQSNATHRVPLLPSATQYKAMQTRATQSNSTNFAKHS